MTQVCITTDKFGASLAEFWHKIKAIFGPKMIGVTFSMSYIFWTSALALYGSMLLQARMLKTEQADLGGCTFEFGQYLMSAPAELASALLVMNFQFF